MLILHGNWVGGKLLLWGETAPEMDEKGNLRNKAPRSPFDPPGPLLSSAVTSLVGPPPAGRSRSIRLVGASLPTRGGHPVPSHAYLAPAQWDSKDKPAAAHWQVLAISLGYFETALIFSAIASSSNPAEALGDKVGAGADLMALSRIWRFAGAVAARQSFLPSIQDNRSRWIPILDLPDRRRLRNFSAALPPSACCLEGSLPFETSAAGFFEDAVDLLVRHAVTTTLSTVHAARGFFDDVHSAWLASLRSPSSEIRWKNPKDIEEFANDLAEWRRPVVQFQGETSRLGFRLTDPADPDVPNPLWKLEPVLVGDGVAKTFTRRSLARLDKNAREGALIGLGQAALLCPALVDGRMTDDGAIALDAAEAHLFLRQTLPLLRASGYGVYVPTWCEPQRISSSSVSINDGGLRIRAASITGPVSEEKGAFSLDSLINVHWELVLGDETLSPEDVRKILSSGRPLVRWNSRWIFADQTRMNDALRRLRQLEEKPVSVRDIVHMAIGAASAFGVPVDISPIARGGALGGLMERLAGTKRIDDLPPPKGFVGELRAYQKRGFSWLAFLSHWGFGACLADDMGLGKTIEAIALYLHLREVGETRPFLVVCPMSIMSKWAREIRNFSPSLKPWIYHGDQRPTGEAFSKIASKADIVITSYQILCMEFASLNRVRWAVVTLDEAQNIKNPATRKSHAARALNAGWRLALTGTPVENHVGDLWALMDFLNPGLLLSRSKFTEVFQRPIQTGTAPEVRDTLKRLTGPFILRRLKTDPEIIAGMPPRIEEKVYCSLSREQAELYAAEIKDISRAIPASMGGVSRRGAVLGLITRLKQICNHPEHYFDAASRSEAGIPFAATARASRRPTLSAAASGDISTAGDDPLASARSGKLERFDEQLDTVLEAGECALVFTQYAVMGKLLQRHIRARLGFDVPFLHGGVPVRQRDEMVAHFQKPDGPPVFILSIKAGGTGLDLTRANHVFHFDRWWNPAVENQATDRAHRIGQRKSVFIHTFICEGTLESRIDDLITSKTELATQLVGSGESWLAKLTDEKLREILALSSSATEGEGGVPQ